MIRTDHHGGKKYQYRVQPSSVNSPSTLRDVVEYNIQGPKVKSAFGTDAISTESSNPLLKGQESTAPIFTTMVEELCKGRSCLRFQEHISRYRSTVSDSMMAASVFDALKENIPCGLGTSF
jgi:hypothetical protein